jgi:hypothetical protein
MTSIVRADNISTVAGTGTVTLEAGNTLDTSAGLVTPAGHVIQVVQDILSTQETISVGTNGTYYDTSLSASITPSSTSSKILVMVNVGAVGGSADLLFRLYRDSTPLDGTGSASYQSTMAIRNNGNELLQGTPSMTYLDSPSTTSATTYSLKVSATGDSITIKLNDRPISPAFCAVSTLTLMEIAG